MDVSCVLTPDSSAMPSCDKCNGVSMDNYAEWVGARFSQP